MFEELANIQFYQKFVEYILVKSVKFPYLFCIATFSCWNKDGHTCR